MLSFSSSDLESTKVDNSLNIFTKFNPLTTCLSSVRTFWILVDLSAI